MAPQREILQIADELRSHRGRGRITPLNPITPRERRDALAIANCNRRAMINRRRRGRK